MLDELRRMVVDLKALEIGGLVDEALRSDLSPIAVLQALREGMDEVGRRFENRGYFISELIMAGKTMNEALSVLKPFLKAEGGRTTGKVVLGSIIGDLHDIGKDIIKSLLISVGFTVHDLGVDVSPERFVKKARETGARIIGVSALLSTSIAHTPKVIEALKKAGLRDNVKVIIGGGAARSWMIEKYGVDAAVIDAIKGLDIIRKWAEEY